MCAGTSTSTINAAGGGRSVRAGTRTSTTSSVGGRIYMENGDSTSAIAMQAHIEFKKRCHYSGSTRTILLLFERNGQSE
jgi:hypothetical protein